MVHSQIYGMKNVILASWQPKTIYRSLQVLQSNYYVLYPEPVKCSLDKMVQIWTFCHYRCHTYQTEERFTVPRDNKWNAFSIQNFETTIMFINPRHFFCMSIKKRTWITVGITMYCCFCTIKHHNCTQCHKDVHVADGNRMRFEGFPWLTFWWIL